MDKGQAVTMVDGFVPVIDLSVGQRGTDRRALASAIGQACENSGFFIVVGHGVPTELVDQMYATTNAFFTLDDAAKDLVANRPGVSGFRRFSGTTAQSIDQQSPPDLCEGFSTHVTGDLSEQRRAELGNYWASWKLANIWPSEPADFKDTWHEYTNMMTELSANLTRLFAIALGCDEGFFEDKFDRHVSSLTANYYYPQVTAPHTGQMRRGPHTDFGGVTVLYQEDDLGGLQVRLPTGEWRDVPAIRGSFVVNIGDLMALWTGGQWVSTMHQVINPQPGDTSSRLSIPFFYQPNHDAVVEPMTPPGQRRDEQQLNTVIAGEWISAKMQKLFAAP